MLKKFAKTDRYWFYASTLADVVAFMICLAIIAYGIITIVSGARVESAVLIIVGVILILLAFVVAFIFWVFMKVYLQLCFDVKLIRNKLYSEAQNNNEQDAENPEQQNGKLKQTVSNDKNTKDIAMQLRELKQLCDDGILSSEEFETEKQRIPESKNNY